MPAADPGAAGEADDRPPFGGSWTYLYAAVLIFLLLQIVVYTLFTRAWA